MSPPAFRATFPGVAYQVGNVRFFSLHAGPIAYIHAFDRWSRLRLHRSKLVSVTSLYASIELLTRRLAGGNNFKTTIIKNGVPTVVADYATVSYCRHFHLLY